MCIIVYVKMVNLCRQRNIVLFPISPGITFAPREIEVNSYAKFWEVDNVHYGLRENVE